MPFNCGISVSEPFPTQAGGREAREHSTTTACRVTGVCSGEGTVILQHGEDPHTPKILSEDRGAFCAQGPLGL